MLVDRNVQFPSRQLTQSIHLSPKPDHRMPGILLALCLVVCTQRLAPAPLTAVARAALPICMNSVSAGVYLDANGNGVREQNELFLAGAIQVVDNPNSVISSFQSVDGLFTLNNIACGEYTVYHNGDYVGKLLVEEVMGQALIELPKAKLVQHIFIPIIIH